MNRLILSILAGNMFVASCSHHHEDTPDPVPDPTIEQRLAANTWKMNQISYFQNTVFGYYERGVAGGGSFMNDRIKYETNGTGVYTNTYDENFNITWQFRDANKEDIDLVIKNIEGGRPAPGENLQVRLDNVVITDDQFRYTEVFTENGSPTMSSVIRTDDGNADDSPSIPTVALADRISEHPWLMEELTYLENNTLNYYKRGVSGGGSFLNDYIKFEKNGTGLYNNTYNEQFAVTWAFKNGNKEDINIVIKNIKLGRPSPGDNLNLKMENVTVKNGIIRYAEMFTSGGQGSMTSVLRKAN